ncbi:hypothetical protein EVAR_60249_1 [Eumeta japonica]|uniref:Uncharacterized protein n=1 Tax=Eumeta variegata TaxID=151549 RepID=A0A4C1ZC59_EUMVA|nr:hypothetical protein EVAR_60249_1 [Eumeta japonica]
MPGDERCRRRFLETITVHGRKNTPHTATAPAGDYVVASDGKAVSPPDDGGEDVQEEINWCSFGKGDRYTAAPNE